MPKRTEETLAAAQADWMQFTRDYGIYNYNIQWLASTYTDSLEYFWSSQTNKHYRGEIENNKYANNELMSDILLIPSDSNEKVIETRIIDLWVSSLPKMYLAESEQECEAAYHEFVSQAESLGLAELEAAYTVNYEEWSAKFN